MNYFRFGSKNQCLVRGEHVSSVTFLGADEGIKLDMISGDEIIELFQTRKAFLKRLAHVVKALTSEKVASVAKNDQELVDKDALNTLLIALNQCVQRSESINPNQAALLLTTYAKCNSRKG